MIHHLAFFVNMQSNNHTAHNSLGLGNNPRVFWSPRQPLDKTIYRYKIPEIKNITVHIPYYTCIKFTQTILICVLMCWHLFVVFEKNRTYWLDLVKSNICPFSLSIITWNIYMKLIKKSDSTISEVKEHYLKTQLFDWRWCW